MILTIEVVPFLAEMNSRTPPTTFQATAGNNRVAVDKIETAARAVNARGRRGWSDVLDRAGRNGGWSQAMTPRLGRMFHFGNQMTKIWKGGTELRRG